MSNEVDKIKQRYKERQEQGRTLVYDKYFTFTHLSRTERELYKTLMLRQNCGSLSDKKILEIGAGHGDNVHTLMRAGLSWENIFLNELLEDRINSLKKWFPGERISEGDVVSTQLPEGSFDIIYQSTVFSSVLDQKLREDIVSKCTRLLKKDGYFLWYDFIYDNPKNPGVKGVKESEVKALFSDYKIVAKKKVTLAPPLGRRVGKAYSFFNFLFPFLRTHKILLLQKK